MNTASAVGVTAERWPCGRRRRRSFLRTVSIFVGLAALAVFVACSEEDAGARSGTNPIRGTGSATEPAPAGNAAVSIEEFAFKPSTVTVRTGRTVTWTNNDDAAHSIRDTSPMASPESNSLNRGDTFSITYSGSGTHSYVCGIHNYMQGSVEVKD